VPTLTRTALPWLHTAPVSDSRRHARLTVDIDLTIGPIQGVLRHQHGADMPFAGWVALIRALELALDIERAQSDPPADPPPGRSAPQPTRPP
jgi:hypothetical protein